MVSVVKKGGWTEAYLKMEIGDYIYIEVTADKVDAVKDMLKPTSPARTRILGPRRFSIRKFLGVPASGTFGETQLLLRVERVEDREGFEDVDEL